MNKLVFIALVCCIILPLYACGKIQQPENTDKISDAEYEVYLVVVNKIKQERKNPLWIANQTKHHQGEAYKSKEEFHYVSGELEKEGKIKTDDTIMEDFYRKNEKCYKLDDRFSAINNISLVSEQEIDSMVDKNKERWGNDKELPGYANLSRVGFNNVRTQALVYYEQCYGMLDGAGIYALLEKKDNKWIIKHEVIIWIS